MKKSGANELKVSEVDAKGTGVPLTCYLKRGYKKVSFPDIAI
jgi:hypothetical protein